MKIILTDDLMEVSPGVMLYTKERLAEILAYIQAGEEEESAVEHDVHPTTGASFCTCKVFAPSYESTATKCRFCGKPPRGG